MIIGKYTATRPNTSVPFYWVNSDPTLVEILQFANNIMVGQFGLPNAVYTEVDSLTATHTWEFPDLGTFQAVKTYIKENGGPAKASERNAWFTSVGHTLLWVATNDGVEIERKVLVS